MTSHRAETEYGSDSEDTDNVSLADTEESNSEEQYDLDSILEEADFDIETEDGSIKTKKFYLIKWSGYSRYRSTWEPTENLIVNDDDALHEWQVEKMRRTRGFKEPFDLNAFEEAVENITAKRVRRHVRRNKKRARLGYPQVDYPMDQDSEEDALSSAPQTPSAEQNSDGERNRIFRRPLRRTTDMRDESSDGDSDTPLAKRRRPSEPVMRTRPLTEDQKQVRVSQQPPNRPTGRIEAAAPRKPLPAAQTGLGGPAPMARMTSGPAAKSRQMSKGRTVLQR